MLGLIVGEKNRGNEQNPQRDGNCRCGKRGRMIAEATMISIGKISGRITSSKRCDDSSAFRNALSQNVFCSGMTKDRINRPRSRQSV